MAFILVYYTLLASMAHWCNLIMEINEYSKKSKEYETSLLTTKKKVMEYTIQILICL